VSDAPGRIDPFAQSEQAIPRKFGVKMGSAAISKGWLVAKNAAGVLVKMAAQIGLKTWGRATQDADPTTATADFTTVTEGVVSCLSQSTSVGDAFVDADAPAPAFGVDNQTIGKLPSGRSIAGVFLGIHNGTEKALVYTGPIAYCLAKALLAASAFQAGANLTDAAATIQIGEGGWRVLQAGVLTANRVLTLGTTNAVAGDEILITRRDVGAFTYTVANGGVGGGNVVVMPVSKAAFVLCVFDGTNWAMKQLGTI
jgi:hypothetical protein